MSAIVAKALNSTLGSGDVKGFDELIGERFKEFADSMRIPLDNVANSLAFRDCKGLVARPNEAQYLFFVGGSGSNAFVATMKCNGSFSAAIKSYTTMSIYINGALFKSVENTSEGDEEYIIVPFSKGDNVRISTNEGNVVIYAQEVNLLAFDIS